MARQCAPVITITDASQRYGHQTNYREPIKFLRDRNGHRRTATHRRAHCGI